MFLDTFQYQCSLVCFNVFCLFENVCIKLQVGSIVWVVVFIIIVFSKVTFPLNACLRERSLGDARASTRAAKNPFAHQSTTVLIDCLSPSSSFILRTAMLHQSTRATCPNVLCQVCLVLRSGCIALHAAQAQVRVPSCNALRWQERDVMHCKALSRTLSRLRCPQVQELPTRDSWTGSSSTVHARRACCAPGRPGTQGSSSMLHLHSARHTLWAPVAHSRCPSRT
jgi:hypothetical protein